MVVEMEYKRFRMTARETSGGWAIKIVPRNGGQIRVTVTCRDISEALDEAKHIIDNGSGQQL